MEKAAQNKIQKWKKEKLGKRRQSVTSIEEIVEDSDDENEDIPSLAACTAKFNEGQREQWVQEMKSLGINF